MTRVENNKVTAYAPFAEGWLRGARPSRGSTTFGDAWKARRVLVMPDGALLVSEDEAGVIYRISYTSRQESFTAAVMRPRVWQESAMFKEFRDFASRGNVIDLAVGVIIGAAFGKIVSSLVNDVVMPPIGMLLGQINFKDLFVALNGTSYPSLAAAQAAAAPTVNYGLFINAIIEFLIVALVVFLMVRQINRLKTPTPTPPAPDQKDCPFCISRIPAAAQRCPFCTSELAKAVRV